MWASPNSGHGPGPTDRTHSAEGPHCTGETPTLHHKRSTTRALSLHCQEEQDSILPKAPLFHLIRPNEKQLHVLSGKSSAAVPYESRSNGVGLSKTAMCVLQQSPSARIPRGNQLLYMNQGRIESCDMACIEVVQNRIPRPTKQEFCRLAPFSWRNGEIAPPE